MYTALFNQSSMYIGAANNRMQIPSGQRPDRRRTKASKNFYTY